MKLHIYSWTNYGNHAHFLTFSKSRRDADIEFEKYQLIHGQVNSYEYRGITHEQTRYLNILLSQGSTTTMKKHERK